MQAGAISNNHGSLEDLRVQSTAKYRKVKKLAQAGGPDPKQNITHLEQPESPGVSPGKGLTTALSLACRNFSRCPARDWRIAAKPTRMEEAKK